MANVLKLEKQVAAISAFVEGASVRSVERMTDVASRHDSASHGPRLPGVRGTATQYTLHFRRA